MVYVNKDIYITLIDIPALLDVRTYGDRLLIVFDKGEMCRFIVVIYNSKVYRGGFRAAPPPPPPPKIGKNIIFWRKIVIFHTKYPKNFRVSLRNWKKYDFLM